LRIGTRRNPSTSIDVEDSVSAALVDVNSMAVRLVLRSVAGRVMTPKERLCWALYSTVDEELVNVSKDSTFSKTQKMILVALRYGLAQAQRKKMPERFKSDGLVVSRIAVFDLSKDKDDGAKGICCFCDDGQLCPLEVLLWTQMKPKFSNLL